MQNLTGQAPSSLYFVLFPNVPLPWAVFAEGGNVPFAYKMIKRRALLRSFDITAAAIPAELSSQICLRTIIPSNPCAGLSSNSCSWPSALLTRLVVPGPGGGGCTARTGAGIIPARACHDCGSRNGSCLTPRLLAPLQTRDAAGMEISTALWELCQREPEQPRGLARALGSLRLSFAFCLYVPRTCCCPDGLRRGFSPGMSPCSCSVFPWQWGQGLSSCLPPSPQCRGVLDVPVRQGQARCEPWHVRPCCRFWELSTSLVYEREIVYSARDSRLLPRIKHTKG